MSFRLAWVRPSSSSLLFCKVRVGWYEYKHGELPVKQWTYPSRWSAHWMEHWVPIGPASAFYPLLSPPCSENWKSQQLWYAFSRSQHTRTRLHTHSFWVLDECITNRNDNTETSVGGISNLRPGHQACVWCLGDWKQFLFHFNRGATTDHQPLLFTSE